jgi:predicted AlkP superfamily pyrophosphatase or phosphodiesterase
VRHIARTLTVIVALGISLCVASAVGSPVQEYDAARRIGDRQVLAISVDGLNVSALRQLRPRRAPHLHRLFRQGARTRNARAQVEKTVTLPNHTSMLTGRRIDASHGGHGVDWNSDRSGTTVQKAAGEKVASIFNVVHRAGGSTALFATESKFSIFRRSWPRAIDRTTIVQDGDVAVTRKVRRDLVRHDRAFTFLHLGGLDEAGHEHGWLGRAYLRAAVRVDRLIGRLLRTIRRHRSLGDVRIVLTADHGGVPGSTHHDDADRLANYRVPFVVWGPGVDRGDLYAMSPRYDDPGRSRPGFRGAQPVRNGDLANLSADLLGLRAVPGSRWGADQRLRWRR